MDGRGRERKGRRRGGGKEEGRYRIQTSFVCCKKKSFLLTKTHALLSDARTVFAELHHTS